MVRESSSPVVPASSEFACFFLFQNFIFLAMVENFPSNPLFCQILAAILLIPSAPAMAPVDPIPELQRAIFVNLVQKSIPLYVPYSKVGILHDEGRGFSVRGRQVINQSSKSHWSLYPVLFTSPDTKLGEGMTQAAKCSRGKASINSAREYQVDAGFFLPLN